MRIKALSEELAELRGASDQQAIPTRSFTGNEEVAKIRKKLNQLEEELANKTLRLNKLKGLLKNVKREAKFLIKYFFNSEIMSHKKFELGMSNAQQVREFLLKVKSLKTKVKE